MSPEVTIIIAMLLAQLFHYMGIEIGSEQLTSLITTLITIGGGIFVWYRHLQAKRQLVGNVNIFGGVKN